MTEPDAEGVSFPNLAPREGEYDITVLFTPEEYRLLLRVLEAWLEIYSPEVSSRSWWKDFLISILVVLVPDSWISREAVRRMYEQLVVLEKRYNASAE